MAQPTKPDPKPTGSTHVSSSTTALTQPAAPTDPYPPYRRIYAWVFQAWLVMFLGVVCIALVFYLLSYIPR